MKMAQVFRFSSEGGFPNVVITGCDLMDIAANITWLIHYIYGKFKKMNPSLAEEFRSILVQVVSDPASPCWEDVEDTPGAIEMCFTVPKEDAE